MKQKNIIAAYDHHYDWGRGLLVWVLSALIIATGFTWFRSQDNHVYDNGSIHLDVPYQWNINSLDYNCSDFYEGCQFVLNRRLDGLHISFHEGGWMNDYEDNQAAADSMWDWSHEGDGFTPLDRETIIIGERTGYLIRYIYNDWYWADIYLHESNSHLRILIEGYTQEVLDSNWDDMLALMNELEWTPNNQ